MSDEPTIESINITPGRVEFALKHSSLGLLVSGLAKIFQDCGATNYLETRMRSDELGEFVVTIQRLDGITPCQKLAALTKERDELREAIKNILDHADNPTWLYEMTATLRDLVNPEPT